MGRWSRGPKEPLLGLKKRALTWPFDEIPPRRRRRGGDGELWERDEEPFEGARALDDLDRVGSDAREAAAVIARYAVLRVALRAEAGLAEWTLFDECAAAAEYLSAGDHSLPEEERMALADVLRQVMRRDTEALLAALMSAGACAARSHHAAGAFALYLAAYRIALSHAWSEAASRAARAVAVLAEDGGGRRAVRRWTRRANALERRAAREAAQREAAPGDSAEG